MAKRKCPPPGLPGLHGDLRRPHVPADVLFRAVALVCRDGRAEVQADRRVHGEGVRGCRTFWRSKTFPKGTSVIAQEFRPGRPGTDPIDTIMQQTIDMTQTELDFQPGDADKAGGMTRTRDSRVGDTAQQAQKAQEQSNTLAKALAEQMQAQIQDGGHRDRGAGSAGHHPGFKREGGLPGRVCLLQPQFWLVIRKVATLLKDVPGEITVSGHSDDVATEDELFQSNWELSSQRAVAVAHQMIKVPGFDGNRLVVQGMADSQPLVPNNSPENRRETGEWRSPSCRASRRSRRPSGLGSPKQLSSGSAIPSQG